MRFHFFILFRFFILHAEFMTSKSPLLSFLLTKFELLFSANANTDETTRSYPTDSSGKDAGWGASCRESRMRLYQIDIPWRRFSLAVQEHRETLLHSHARISSALWTTRVLKANCKSKIYWQEDRLPRSYAVAGWTSRRALAHYKLLEKVSSTRVIHLTIKSKISCFYLLVTSIVPRNSSSVSLFVPSVQLHHRKWRVTWQARSKSWWSHQTLIFERKQCYARSASFVVCLSWWKFFCPQLARCWTRRIMVRGYHKWWQDIIRRRKYWKLVVLGENYLVFSIFWKISNSSPFSIWAFPLKICCLNWKMEK